MTDPAMLSRMGQGLGFIAALDQSGGSTPGALKAYGVPEGAYSNDAEMFALMHEMRVRIMTAPAFSGDKVIGAILFEATMDGTAAGRPVPDYLWRERGVVPFLKVDLGLQAESDGARMMKPIPNLDVLLSRAVKLGVFGTKMRSVINRANEKGIADVVAQQFELGAQIAAHGLVPIIEPEISIDSPDKAAAEEILRAALSEQLDRLPANRQIILKLTIPNTPNYYTRLIEHPRALRVVALSGGYSRDEACQKLAHNKGMIASFSRALTEELRYGMDDATFSASLAESIDAIFTASTKKV